MTVASGEKTTNGRSTYSSSTTTTTVVDNWVQERFKKRECVRVVPVSKDSSKCGCGRHLALHYYFEGEEDSTAENADHASHGWSRDRCTAKFPTDAYGTLTFRVGKGSRKARYIRTDFDTDPADLWLLLVHVWGLEPPDLVITIQDDGADQSPLSDELIKAIKKGLTKAARTGSTWIITSGLKTGINEAITAFSEASSVRNNKRSQRVQVIGFAPWGLVRGADQLIVSTAGGSATSSWSAHYSGLQQEADEAAVADDEEGQANKRQKCVRLLGEGHSGFMLVDDGSVGRPSAKANILRYRFEHFLRTADGFAPPLKSDGSRRVKLVCLMANGRRGSFDAFLDYVTNEPAVPVVVVAKTGGVADWIATIYQTVHNSSSESVSRSTTSSTLPRRLSRHIQAYMGVDKAEAHRLADLLGTTVSAKADLITVYDPVGQVGGGSIQIQELDVAILNGLLKGLNLSEAEKLNLTVSWDREDLAREILAAAGNVEWPDGSLDEAMMNALMYDRVDFVNLLLSTGVAMDRFLTIARLERLYNTNSGPSNTLQFILRDVVKDTNNPNYKCKLPHVGLVVEKLMGNGYRSVYCRKEFRKRHKAEYMLAQRRRKSTLGNSDDAVFSISGGRPIAGPRNRPHFTYPYHELFIWAVLTNRKQLAMQFWQQGQEQLAKALVGGRLYESLAKEAEEDYFEMEVCQQLLKNAKEFKSLACELLSQCYETDDDLTLQLLTYELSHFSRSTCISLAASSKNAAFIAHQSCQILLADLWLGGLRLRKSANLKVLASILFPPMIATLTFKTKEELQLQAQTAEESETYRVDRDVRKKSWAEVGSSTSSTSASNSDVEADEDEESMISEELSNNRRRTSRIRLQSQVEPADSVHYAAASGMVNLTPRLLSDRRRTSQRKWSSALSLEGFAPDSRTRSQNQRRESHQYQPQCLSVSNFDDAQQSPSPKQRRLPPKHPFKRFATAFDLSVGQQVAPRGAGAPPPVPLIREPRRRQQLEFRRKILEFYSAPVAAFWSSTIAYIIFVSFFTYVVLVRTPIIPEWPEYYVIVYIVIFSADLIRKIILQEPRRKWAKIRVFCTSVWDSCAAVACTAFYFALVLRLEPETLATGRVLYCINIVFWYLYALKVMNVNSTLNPYIHMYGRMVLQLFLLSSILFVTLASFGVFRQSINHPDEDWHWALLRNVTYEPYSYLYGSLYPDEITQCQDEGVGCTPGVWLTPLLMTIYLLLAMVVFMNMMVAAFSYIFTQVNARAQEIAKFESYRHVMEYEQQPFLPPPLTIFSHFYMIGKYLYRRYCKKIRNYRFEHSLKLFLTPQDKEKLHEFERDCLNDLLAKKAEGKANTLESRLHHLAERMEAVTSQVDHLQEQTYFHRIALIKLSGLVAANCGNDLVNRCEDSLGVVVQIAPDADVLSSPVQSTSDFEADSKLVQRNPRFRFAADGGKNKSGPLASGKSAQHLPSPAKTNNATKRTHESRFPGLLAPPISVSWLDGSHRGSAPQFPSSDQQDNKKSE